MSKPSKKAKSSSSPTSTLKSKSPAEFFSEHQNIAGFDNAGKVSLATFPTLTTSPPTARID